MHNAMYVAVAHGTLADAFELATMPDAPTVPPPSSWVPALRRRCLELASGTVDVDDVTDEEHETLAALEDEGLLDSGRAREDGRWTTVWWHINRWGYEELARLEAA